MIRMASHQDLEKVKHLLRYNNWQHDPLSAAGYRGPTEPRAPENAIAARYDLHPWPKVGCVSRLDMTRSSRTRILDDFGQSIKRQTLHHFAIFRFWFWPCFVPNSIDMDLCLHVTVPSAPPTVHTGTDEDG